MTFSTSAGMFSTNPPQAVVPPTISTTASNQAVPRKRRVVITVPTFNTTVLPNADSPFYPVPLSSREMALASMGIPATGEVRWEIADDSEPQSATQSTRSTTSASQNALASLDAASTAANSANKSGMAISVVNVVCNFTMRCHVNLRQLAKGSVNAVYRLDKNIVEMVLRNPKCAAKIFSSGKVFAVGATTEADARKAARRIARRVQKCGHPMAKFAGFRINNIMATSRVNFSVRLQEIGDMGPPYLFEPELGNRLHVNYKEIRTSVNVAPNGNVTIFANKRARVVEGLKRIYPVLFKHRCIPGSVTVASPRPPSPSEHDVKESPNKTDDDEKVELDDRVQSSVDNELPSGAGSLFAPLWSINAPTRPSLPTTTPFLFSSALDVKPMASVINLAEAFVPRPVVTTQAPMTPYSPWPASATPMVNSLTPIKAPYSVDPVDPLADLDDILDKMIPVTSDTTPHTPHLL